MSEVETQEVKAPRELKDSTKAVVNFLTEALSVGPVTKRNLWKSFNEANPALVSPAAFGSIAKRSVYSGLFIVTGEKAESLALRQ